MNHQNAKMWVGNPVVTTVDKRAFPKGTIGILVGITAATPASRWVQQRERSAKVWISNGQIFSIGLASVEIVDGTDARSDEVQDLIIAYTHSGSPRMS